MQFGDEHKESSAAKDASTKETGRGHEQHLPVIEAAETHKPIV